MHATHAQQLACSPLRERYQEIRRKSLELTQPYSAEDQMLQSMPDASPAKWHLAHTTWFFETFILGRMFPLTNPSINDTNTSSTRTISSLALTLTVELAG